MIQYALKCCDGHVFDSWFQSAEAYEKLAKAGMVSCVECGSSQVEKAIMTPRVRPARSAAYSTVSEHQEATPTVEPPAPSQPGLLSQPASELEKAVTELRKQVETNSDYVGENFADEARAMHVGDAPSRAIYGEAKIEEAKALIEEGVPVTPLPFRPNRKTN